MSKLSRSNRQMKERFNNICMWSHRFDEIDSDAKSVQGGISLEEMSEWMKHNHFCGDDYHL